MAKFNQNIWTLFYIILFLSFLVLGNLAFFTFSQTKSSFKNEQEVLVETVAENINNILLQYESIFDIVNQNIYEKNLLKNEKKLQKYFDTILHLNTNLAGFGVFDKNGNILAASKNVKKEKLPNMLKNKYTKDDFLKALQNDTMVIGRTYFVKAVGSVVIPIRKAFKDQNGNVLFVTTAGLKVQPDSTIFKSKIRFSEIVIIRDHDRYIQFKDFSIDTYKKQIPKDIMTKFEESIKVACGITKKQLNDNKTTNTLVFKYFDNKRELVSFAYLKRYNLWILAKTDCNVIYKAFAEKFSIFIVLYIVVWGIIYYLFKVIDRSNETQKKVLKDQAVHDYLTGLYNRYYLTDMFNNSSNFLYKDYTLFFIDLDNFKSINDNFGHVIGDKLLKEVSKRLQDISKEKPQRKVIRYSGDEFLFIFEYLNDKDIAYYAEKITSQLSKQYTISDISFLITCSMGISKFPDDGDSFDEVKINADIAMYHSKKFKNTWTIFNPKQKQKYIQNIQIEQELKKAIENDELYMVYQPQVNSFGDIVGVEALVRWENKKLGFVPPDKFINVAENSALIYDIGDFIVDRTLKDICEIFDKTKKSFRVSVNVSAKQFLKDDFEETLVKKILDSNIKNSHICIEITESLFVSDKEKVIKILNNLKESFITVSMDDFGTGYSSLSMLKDLPVDEVKIDKSFVDDITVDENDKKLVQSIIYISNILGKTILAEGVETKEQKDLLDTLGCELYQGYYFYKPLKKEELVEVLKG